MIYTYDRHHCRYTVRNLKTVDQAIRAAAYDIAEGLAIPIRLQDDFGRTILNFEEYNDLAWEYICGDEEIQSREIRMFNKNCGE